MPPATTTPVIDLDLAIIGGGIAGLWLLNRGQSAGYRCALFESNALGSDQTIASQGMIHGGMKYTLAGAFTNASEAIADMPHYWRTCLQGEGDVDLRSTRILSDHFFLWSSESASSRLATFLASKLIRGRAVSVDKAGRPPLLQHSGFSGSLYRIADLVLDVPSLLENLAQPVAEQLFQIDWSQAQLQRAPGGEVQLLLRQGESPVLVRARRFLFTAGQGNAALLAGLGLTKPEMQLRPLQQVMVKHSLPHHFYGHCLGADTTPRLTISSHPTADGKQVWYLGGSLAEKGATQSAAEVIAAARQELAALMPWLDLGTAQWASLPVNRAELRQHKFARPDDVSVEAVAGAGNLRVAWPTKLTLAPNIARRVLAELADEGAVPGAAQPRTSEQDYSLLRRYLPLPPIAPPPWDLAFAQPSNPQARYEI